MGRGLSKWQKTFSTSTKPSSDNKQLNGGKKSIDAKDSYTEKKKAKTETHFLPTQATSHIEVQTQVFPTGSEPPLHVHEAKNINSVLPLMIYGQSKYSLSSCNNFRITLIWFLTIVHLFIFLFLSRLPCRICRLHSFTLLQMHFSGIECCWLRDLWILWVLTGRSTFPSSILAYGLLS